MKAKKRSIVDIRRTPAEIKADKLLHAPWNPRPKITRSDVEDMVLTIRENGLIHRLDVWEEAKGKFVVIDGNRRLVACVIAGMKKIPCDILDIDERTARKITLTANLQRKDVDPFMQADNIIKLVRDGGTVEEIASSIGRSPSWVSKRMQLTNIADGYKRIHAEHPFTIDALEKISRYSKTVQLRALECLCEDLENDNEDGDTAWKKIKYAFDRLERSLLNASFDTSQCEKCHHNTATQADLFSFNGDGLFLAKDGKTCGVCMNETCYSEKMSRWAEETERSLEEKCGCKVKHFNNSWNIGGGWSEKRSEEYNVPASYTNCNNEKVFVWMRPPEKSGGGKTSEEKAVEREEKRKKRALNSACKKIAEWCDGHLEAEIGKMFGLEQAEDERRAILAKHVADRISVNLYCYPTGAECALVFKTIMPEPQAGDSPLLDEDEEAAVCDVWTREFGSADKD